MTRTGNAVKRIAVIEDDGPTSGQLRGWIEAAVPGVELRQLYNRDEAESALAQDRFDLVVLDIELGRERHAGIALINLINKRGSTPVLVVSGLPAATYRSIMKALDAWDYLQKSNFSESDFTETVLEMLRSTRTQTATMPDRRATNELSIDPLRQTSPTWHGERINLPMTAQRILALLYARKGEVVSYEELFGVVKSGRNRDNVRKHVAAIRDALRDVDASFDGIENIPMRGFRWTPP